MVTKKNFEELVEGEWYQLRDGSIGQAKSNPDDKDYPEYPFLVCGEGRTKTGLFVYAGGRRHPLDVVMHIKPPVIETIMPSKYKRKRMMTGSNWWILYT